MAATPLRLSPVPGLGLGVRFQLRQAPAKVVRAPAQPTAAGATTSTIDIEATYNLSFRATIPRRHPLMRSWLAEYGRHSQAVKPPASAPRYACSQAPGKQ